MANIASRYSGQFVQVVGDLVLLPEPRVEQRRARRRRHGGRTRAQVDRCSPWTWAGASGKRSAIGPPRRPRSSTRHRAPPGGTRRRRHRRRRLRSAMDFELPPDDDPRRMAVRAWLADHPKPSGRELAEAGYVAPHWPRPWGLDADPVHQLLIDDELAPGRGVAGPSNPIGIGWAGPTIVHAGTEEQKERYLFPLLAGEEIWCQLFSEPDAGSDLADLGTRAVRDGDEWVVNGQKIWTSRSPGLPVRHPDRPHRSRPAQAPGHLLLHLPDGPARHRDPPDRRDDRRRTTFNEVFFTDVRLPAANLVGEANRGWSLAKVTLGNERVSLSGGGALWGMGPTAGDLIESVRKSGGCTDRLLRQRLAQLHIESEILRLIRLRTLTSRIKGEPAGPGGERAQDPRRRARPAHHGSGQGSGRVVGDAGRRRPARRSRRCGTTGSCSPRR